MSAVFWGFDWFTGFFEHVICDNLSIGFMVHIFKLLYFTQILLYLCRDLSHLVASSLPCFPFAPVPEYTKFNRLYLKGATHPYRRSLHADYIQSVSILWVSFHNVRLASTQEEYCTTVLSSSQQQCWGPEANCNGHCSRLWTKKAVFKQSLHFYLLYCSSPT